MKKKLKQLRKIRKKYFKKIDKGRLPLGLNTDPSISKGIVNDFLKCIWKGKK